MNVYMGMAEQRLRKDPNDPDALFTLATWLAILNRPSESIEYLDRLTRVDPGYPGVWQLKARVYRQLGDEERARECDDATDRYKD